MVAAELDGFTHREIALIAAVTLCGREEDGAAAYRPLVSRDERPDIQRAGLLLALADDIEERCPGEGAIALRCEVGPRQAVVTVKGLAGWRPRAIGTRFEALYERRLEVRASLDPSP